MYGLCVDRSSPMGISMAVNRKLKIAMMMGCLLCVSLSGYASDGGISDSNRYAWSENAGWANFNSSYNCVTVYYDKADSYLIGYAWAENVGWIKMGDDDGGPYGNTASNDWGVNMDSAWELSGYAWGENIGWINFNPTHAQVEIDQDTGCFSGYAWGENIGYIHFTNATPNYVVRRVVIMATNNVPHWWLRHYGWTNNFDDAAIGDQDTDLSYTWQEYIANTVPTNAESVFTMHTTMVDSVDSGVLTWASEENRTYTIEYSTNLVPTLFDELTNSLPSTTPLNTYTVDLQNVSSIYYRVQVEKSR